MSRRFMQIVKKILVSVISQFIPSRNARIIFRINRFVPEIVLEPARLPIRPDKPVDIAFCFDSGRAAQAAVAILSLIQSAGGARYNIYCVVDESVGATLRGKLESLAGDAKSKITFLEANGDFDQSNRGNWARAIWFRLMLPKLLPDVRQIIYADSDVIFTDSLAELAMLDLGENLLAAVVEDKHGTFNSGFLVMNLEQIRRAGVYDEWIEMSRTYDFPYPDQELLNRACAGKTLDLPLKYNFRPGMCYRIAGSGRFSEQEWSDLKYHCAVIHYAGGKPWENGGKYDPMSEIWWKYAKMTGMFG